MGFKIARMSNAEICDIPTYIAYTHFETFVFDFQSSRSNKVSAYYRTTDQSLSPLWTAKEDAEDISYQLLTDAAHVSGVVGLFDEHLLGA